MRISNKSEYAVRAVTYLAKNYNKGVLQLNEIAKHEQIPVKFLEQILFNLKNAGLINSKRGIKGGYTLAKDPSLLTVGEVIRVIEGSLTPFDCIGNSTYKCFKQSSCEIKNLWSELDKAICDVLDKKTFSDLVNNGLGYQGSYI